MAQEFGIRLALIAFLTASLQGVASGQTFDAVLKTALLTLAAFFVFGWVCGHIAKLAVNEFVRAQWALEHPPAESVATTSPLTSTK